MTAKAHDDNCDSIAYCNENSAPLFKKLGYHEVLLEDEVNPESVKWCKEKCKSYTDATDKTSIDDLKRRIDESTDPIERARNIHRLSRMKNLGVSALRCCDNIFLHEQKDEILYVSNS